MIVVGVIEELMLKACEGFASATVAVSPMTNSLGAADPSAVLEIKNFKASGLGS